MTVIKAHLSGADLEARYKTAVDPIGKSHFHALWLLWCGYELDEVAELLSFSPRLVRALLKRYNECGAQALGRSAQPQRNKADDPHTRCAGGAQGAAQDAA